MLTPLLWQGAEILAQQARKGALRPPRRVADSTQTVPMTIADVVRDVTLAGRDSIVADSLPAIQIVGADTLIEGNKEIITDTLAGKHP